MINNRSATKREIEDDLMKTFPSLAASKFVLLMLVAFVIYCGQTAAQTAEVEKKSRVTWEWNDDGWKRRLEIQGKAEFTEDYTDISSVTEGSVVRIEEDQHGQSRKLEVSRGAGGPLSRRYFVNGELRPLDDAGRKWLAGLLLIAVRQGAFDADNRTQTILRKHGVDGVLAEITQITGEYAKRVYFQALLKNENLGSSEFPKILHALSTQISSDHEKANLLKSSAELFLSDARLSNAFFQAVRTVGSDHERRRTLSSLLSTKNLREETWLQMLETAASISSDYEKATFLLEASKIFELNTRVRDAFLKTVETIKSDHERGRVLNALLRNKQLS